MACTRRLPKAGCGAPVVGRLCGVQGCTSEACEGRFRLQRRRAADALCELPNYGHPDCNGRSWHCEIQAQLMCPSTRRSLSAVRHGFREVARHSPVGGYEGSLQAENSAKEATCGRRDLTSHAWLTDKSTLASAWHSLVCTRLGRSFRIRIFLPTRHGCFVLRRVAAGHKVC